MIGIKLTNTTTTTGTNSIWPYIVSTTNNWLIRKNTGTEASHNKNLEVNDFVVDGTITIDGELRNFSGQYLGGATDDINNFNSFGTIRLNT